MGHLPLYIKIVFVLSALFALLTLYKAKNYSRPLIVIMLLWLALQSVIGLSEFYTVIDGVPPRFALLILPPFILIAGIFLTKRGRVIIYSFDVKTLTLIHMVRVPVELTLYWLYLNKVVPEVMTFEGRNFDILCGLSAPFVYYFGYVKNILSRKVLIVWNIAGLLLLINIVVTAVLSAPLSFQQFAFDQPNIALFYFPFIWLPCFIVPAVLFTHLVSLRQLMLIKYK
jgi:hypothetical protein